MTVKAQTDPLDKEEAEILLKLSLLSSASSANYDKEGARGVLGSKPPPGFSEGLQGSLSPNLSLWAYHKAQLENARERGLSVRLTALGSAVHDYETTKKRPPDYFSPDSDANTRLRNWAILRWKGKRAEWVAAVEGCSFNHVRRLRKKEGLNQVTGEAA